MIIDTIWFERKFNFNLPVELFPCIIERLRGTPARMEEIVNSLPKRMLTIKPDNRWSIQEHAGHLIDIESLFDKRLNEFIAKEKVLCEADMKNRKTDEACYNNQVVDELLKSFRVTRMNFVIKLEKLDKEDVTRTALHPRLNQPMRIIDMAFFAAEHDDHHLAYITKLTKSC